MAKLKVNQGRVTKEAAEQLKELCPFGAISEEDGKLSVSSGCRMCRLCVKKVKEQSERVDYKRP